MGNRWGYSALAALAAGLLTAPATQATAQAQRQTAKCETLESCIAEVRDPNIRVNGSDIPAKDRIARFGDDAIVALLPLLKDPNQRVHRDAGYLLHAFRDVDPRHFDALVAGWKNEGNGRRNGWLIIPIAATRTDEALELLWADFERDPNTSSNSQIFFALPMFGEERLKPLVLRRLEECRVSLDGKPCAGINALLNEMEEPIRGIDKISTVDWVEAAMVELARDPQDHMAKGIASDYLTRRLHPAGVPLLTAFLDTIDVDELVSGEGDYYPTLTIVDLTRYGGVANEAGPSIARFLDSRLSNDIRADAALALGKIGAAQYAPDLTAMEPDLWDDWLLAYNVAEALGRMRASEARPLLQRLVASHWHRGVRNNANRALKFMTDSAFAQPDRTFETGLEELTDRAWGTFDLRWEGDEARRGCYGEGDDFRLRQDPIARIRFPKEGARPVDTRDPTNARRAAARKAVPQDLARGSVQAIGTVSKGDLVALNGGEWGGGLVLVPVAGKPRVIVGGPITDAWEMDGKLYVVEGLSHLVFSQGSISILDKRSLEVERTIRLPAAPSGLTVTADRAVIVKTHAGHVAIMEDGTLKEPTQLPACD